MPVTQGVREIERGVCSEVAADEPEAAAVPVRKDEMMIGGHMRKMRAASRRSLWSTYCVAVAVALQVVK